MTRPEAETEYSRGDEASGGALGAPSGGPAGLSGTVAAGVLVGGLAGAALLAIAEFTPLLSVQSGLSAVAVKTVQTGSHNSFALIPIALLAAALSVVARRAHNPLALLAIGVLGLAALLIALVGDLPDAQASGLIIGPSARYALASSSPEVGFYLETLGAVILLICAGAGLLLTTPARHRALRPRD
ncbi:MAG: hypothetical protein ACRDNK_04175 [Solirubrobacteraceae bacterium]